MQFEEYLKLLERAKPQGFWSQTSTLLHLDLFKYVEAYSGEAKGIIEVGCLKGGSTILLAYLCRERDWPLYVVDIEKAHLGFVSDLLRGLELWDRVHFFLGTLADFAVRTQLQARPLLVFIDGDHAYESVRADIRSLFALNARPHAAVFHDFSLRAVNPDSRTAAVDSAILDSWGQDVPLLRVGSQYGEDPFHSIRHPSSRGSYIEAGGTEAVLVELEGLEVREEVR